MLKIKLFRMKPFPLYVNLVINSKCNLDCVYCFGAYAHRKDPEWTLEELKKIIDELHSMGTRFMLLQGGEPFLRKDLNELIEYVYAKGIIPAIVSNGTMPNKIREVSALAKLDNLCFSLDGMKEGNDAQRGKGVFDRVMQSIDEARKYYPKLKLRTNAVITKNTIGTFKDYLRFCWDKGIEVQVGLMFKDSPLAVTDKAQLDDINKFIYESKKKGKRIVASSGVLKYVMDWPFDTVWVTKEQARKVLGKKAIECQYGNYEIIVDSNGDVFPCNCMQGTFKPKNLRKVGLKEAIGHLKNKPCYTCNAAAMMDTSEVINWNWRTILERIMLELKAMF